MFYFLADVFGDLQKQNEKEKERERERGKPALQQTSANSVVFLY